MKKRIIALFIVFTMLVSFSPAVAAENASAKPTIEEILSEYHQKAFQAETAEDAAAVANYMQRTAAEGKTLEQETVDQLNTAGYEAYNVTSANYSALESQLQTDFSDMGLDPDGSYIITIRGKDGENAETLNNISPAAIVPAPDMGGDYYLHTYNGKTYKMRHVTVTAAYDNSLAQTSHVTPNSDEISAVLEWVVSVLADGMGMGIATTIYSLIASQLPDGSNTSFSSLIYQGCTVWTVDYIQVKNESTGTWHNAASREYVTAKYYIYYTYYEPTINNYTHQTKEGNLGIKYSPNYSNDPHLDNMAAIAYERESCFNDTIDEVKYYFDGNLVITHLRNMP